MEETPGIVGKTCYIVKLHYCYRHGDARRRHGNTVSDAFKERGPGRCLAVHGLAFFFFLTAFLVTVRRRHRPTHHPLCLNGSVLHRAGMTSKIN